MKKIERREEYVNLDDSIEYEKQADFLFCTNFSILDVIPKIIYKEGLIEVVNVAAYD